MSAIVPLAHAPTEVLEGPRRPNWMHTAEEAMLAISMGRRNGVSGRTPLRPASRPAQVSGADRPTGVTAPIPVITARVMKPPRILHPCGTQLFRHALGGFLCTGPGGESAAMPKSEQLDPTWQIHSCML